MSKQVQKITKRLTAFTLIELLVVISIIALLIGILLPALGAARRTARQLQNSTQLRGIHQGMVTFSQSNKSGGSDGKFAGLDGDGSPADTEAADTDAIGGDGQTVGTSNILAIMLNGNYFTPEYVINPSDSGKTAAENDTELTSDNFSYAFLDITDDFAADPATVLSGVDTQRRNEWSETLNTQAVVISDRNTGADAGNQISSPWTEEDEGDWRGTMTKNDNSTSFETSEILEDTQYGNGTAADADDNLFVPDDGGAAPADGNAAMVYDAADTYVDQD